MKDKNIDNAAYTAASKSESKTRRHIAASVNSKAIKRLGKSMTTPSDKQTDNQPRRYVITDRQVITELAAGGRIIATDEGDGYSYKLIRNEIVLSSSQLLRLLDEGWIYSSNTAYFLTDEGKKSYLKSTDELGDGRLLAPKPR